MSKKSDNGRGLPFVGPQITQTPPLFPSFEAHVLSRLMYEKFIQFISDMSYGTQCAEIWTSNVDPQPIFLRIANKYLFDKIFLDVSFQLSIRKDIQAANLASGILSRILSDLPINARSMLNESMSTYKSPRGAVGIDALLAMLSRLEKACAPVVALKAKRQGRPSLSYACDRLWTLWEEITGRPFVRSWEEAPGRQKLGEGCDAREFVKLDAQFVLSIVSALDPTIRLSQVRDALKSIAKIRPRIEGEARPRRNSRQKTPPIST